jgi:hypothetical protein
MGSPVKPGLMLVNPGSVAANVTVTILPTSGAAGGTSSIRVPPGAVTGVPASFIDRAAEAAVLVRSADGPVIALGVSTSGGPDGTQWFASSAGVAVPASSA